MQSIIVFGFNQTEFIGNERLQNHAVGIGFLSGSVSQDVIGSIQLTPITAGNSYYYIACMLCMLANDCDGLLYTLGTGDVRLLGGNIINISSGSTDQQLVHFALLVDAVAQEADETFIISLNLNTPLSVLGNNMIIISKVKGTIIDTNGVSSIDPELVFVSYSYAYSESIKARNQFMQV